MDKKPRLNSGRISSMFAWIMNRPGNAFASLSASQRPTVAQCPGLGSSAVKRLTGLVAILFVLQAVGFVVDYRARAETAERLRQVSEECAALKQQVLARSACESAPSASQPESRAAGGELIVYYFHGNTRCPTCQAIESQVKQTLEGHFGEQLKQGAIAWKVLNYEQSASVELAKEFDIQMPVAVVAQRKDGRTERWRRLDRVWALLEDKAAFDKYLCDEIAYVETGVEPSSSAFPEFTFPK